MPATPHAGNPADIREIAQVVERVDFAPAVRRSRVDGVALRDAIQLVIGERSAAGGIVVVDDL